MIRLATLALVLLCAGCLKHEASDTRSTAESTDYVFPGNYRAREFNLKDGTRCVAIDHKGITCEWKAKP